MQVQFEHWANRQQKKDEVRGRVGDRKSIPEGIFIDAFGLDCIIPGRCERDALKYGGHDAAKCPDGNHSDRHIADTLEALGNEYSMVKTQNGNLGETED